MRLLGVPNWSFGRERSLVRQVRDLLDASGLDVHFCEADIDHNRTVTAYSGDGEAVFATTSRLADLVLPAIDLTRHRGVHPRVGGLDVCPFVPLGAFDPDELRRSIERFAAGFATAHEVPVFLYEHSSKAGRRLPDLRKGGFGGLLGRELEPDFGPSHAHPFLGATVVGWRDFLVAMNVNLDTPDPGPAERIAAHIRQMRRSGTPGWQGVRALGLPLASRNLSQVSLNLTKPDLSPIDPVVEWIEEEAAQTGVRVAYPEIIGVVRDVDMEHNTKVPCRREQVVET
ncbi:MAG: hypothetical protein KF857_09940 [Fimbriimonadaceae bacterium]|nr:hypothetical protein [Fimbriimonadaceae bacterium]